jgi:hypothetical protein
MTESIADGLDSLPVVGAEQIIEPYGATEK